jgi:hypothetical protein
MFEHEEETITQPNWIACWILQGLACACCDECNAANQILQAWLLALVLQAYCAVLETPVLHAASNACPQPAALAVAGCTPEMFKMMSRHVGLLG